MAARHLSQLKPLEAGRYAAIAEDHYTVAVTESTRLLTRLSAENAQAMYGATMLIAFYSFARGPTPGDVLVFSHGKTVPWLCLLQGVKLIVHTLGHSAIFHDVFAPGSEPEEEKEFIPIDSALMPSETGETWQQPLNELLGMIDHLRNGNRNLVYAKQGT